MPYIFPGMNPYLEHPELFPGLHHLLISEIARFLSPQLRPKYRVAVEVRMYETTDENSLLVGIPDVIVKNRQTVSDFTNTNVAVAAPTPEPIKVKIPMPVNIREGYLEVREVETEVLITTIEILSPTNKRTGKGRQIYEEKRTQVLASRTNLVEIDLLRKGEAMAMMGNDIQSDYRILVCRGDTGEEINTLEGHKDCVRAIAFSPNGQTLASGSQDNNIILWDWQNNRLIRTLKGHSNAVTSLAFSPDGLTLVSGSDDKTIKLWNVQTGLTMITLFGHESYVESVAFSPDGKNIVSGGYDKTVKVWQMPWQ